MCLSVIIPLLFPPLRKRVQIINILEKNFLVLTIVLAILMA